MLDFNCHLKDNKTYFSPFSLYQLALFLYDILVFVIVLYLVFLNGNIFLTKEMLSVFFLAMPALIFFPAYGLYSYHTIFRAKDHIIRILKAFTWSLVSLSVIYFLYNWPYLFSGNSLYEGILILLAAFLIAILGRFIADYLAHLVIAIGVAFIFVGMLGLLIGKHPPIFVGNIHRTMIALMTAMIIVAVGRYFIVQTVFTKWLRRYFRRQTIIVGVNNFSKKIIKYIIDNHAPFWVYGLITIDNNEKHAETERDQDFLGKEVKGDINKLPKILKENSINEIIITDKSIARKDLITLLDFLVSTRRVAWFPPELLPIIPMKLQIDNFSGIPMIRMCLQRNPVFFEKIKRLTDIVLSSMLILLLSPLLALVAIAIKLDSKGPIFYLAEAVGKDGKRFKMFKFRSMYVDGDPNIHKQFVTKFIKGEIDKEKEKVLKITDDPRVTKVGRIIRRLSIDELPQLFNVFKGDMSLVGPRPCLPYEYELYKDWHRKRNSVVPGITGLWQIAGRSEVDFEEMILLDLYYIYNRNLLMDLAILFETIFVVLQMEGAY